MLDPPDHVVQIPRCDVVGIPRLTDVCGPFGNPPTTDPVIEHGIEGIAECSTHQVSPESGRSRTGTSLGAFCAYEHTTGLQREPMAPTA
ncbi:hypothetical protein RHA1_ro00280 [Rhodococcus jostii RHA1]|uniref:Uncharacterized protein n=1 Tax=Rhodococcus jostii (strain RHA1) TaxID=101510 RepID=Q0SK20_RHOJR|nr:hypothetical protein RHA1_ro00280 [Rhodococcus jostii RHA1]